MKIVNIAERMAEEIRKGSLPEAAAVIAVKAAGRAETIAWLEEATGRKVPSRWNLLWMARRVTEHLLSKPGAWESVWAAHVRVGDFIVLDEDALAWVSGYDRDGEAVAYADREEVSWDWVVSNGIRVDKRVGGEGGYGYATLIQQNVCGCCKRPYEEEDKGETVYAGASVLRLRYVGSHRVGA